MKCPICNSRKKTRRIKKLYPFKVFQLPVYELHCNKCDFHWLPIKEEKKLDKELKFYRRKYGVE